MVEYFAGEIASIWYKSEAVEGTTDATPAMLHLAHKTSVDWGNDVASVPVRLGGGVDLADIGKGFVNPSINFNFNPSNASGKAFMKNHGSSDTPFTLMILIDRGTDFIFARMVGCKTKSLSGKVSSYPTVSAVECNVTVWGWNVLFTAVASTTYEAVPSSILTWANTTIKKNTVTITNWWDFEFTIDNELYRNHDNTGVINGIVRGIRDVTGSVTRSVDDTEKGQTEYAEVNAATDVDWELGLNGDLWNFVDTVGEAQRVSLPQGLVGNKVDWRATSLTIT